MSTNPVTPAPSAQTVQNSNIPPTVVTSSKTVLAPLTLTQDITKDLAWVKTHAIIAVLTTGLIVGSTFAGVSLVESLLEKHDQRAAAAQQKAEGVDTATQAALVAQLTEEHTQNAERDAQQQALIQSLITQMKVSQAATAKQVATDSTLSAQETAARLSTQTQATDGQVTAGMDTVIVALPIAHAVVADLDEYQQAQGDVTNLQGQFGAQQQISQDRQTELDSANKIISADKSELLATVKADNTACQVKVDAQASKDRKRGFWATLGGFLGGMVLGTRI